MRTSLGVVTALAVILTMACGKDEKRVVRPLTAQEQALVQSSNTFGFDLFKEAVTQSDGGNLFISPLSVSMALGMTHAGARGTTEQGMRQTLAFGEMTTDEINQSYKSLIHLLTTMDPKVTMEIANSIWYRAGLTVLAEFVSAVESSFNAVVTALDFSAPGAADTINTWVSDKTHGKIPSIVDNPIDIDTVMFLINAIYFKGSWSQKFDADATRDATFHAPAGDKTVKMMHLDKSVPYLNAADFQAVDLAYGDGLFGMMVILPKEGHAIEAVAAELTAANWSEWTAALNDTEINVGLPRFELSYDTLLNDVLIAMGMADAFDGSVADFSGIDGLKDLFVSRVKHKTFVKVDEQGTEAAAVTSVEIKATAVMDNRMIVDRPFLFVIHDSHSQALLFMGKIVDPDANG
jgi:serine protease inhibitor